MAAEELEQIFNPRSVAVVGASNDPTFMGHHYIEYLIEFGFKGHIYPINLKQDMIQGLKAYPNLSTVPEDIDYVISCAPAAAIPQILEECRTKHVKCAQLFTARFSETGRKEAANLEQKILNIARRNNVRIIGPNCIGIYNPKIGLSFAYNLPKEPGTVGMISQTGGGAAEFAHAASMRGVRFSKVVSYGNALDFNECDYLDYFAQDEETKVITIYIEGVKDGPRFMKTLKETAAIKPVVLVKGGRGKSGSRMTSSHTASIAGSFNVWEAAIKQAGAVSARDFEELTDLVVTFCIAPPFFGNRVGIIGGGGPSVIAADACDEAGLDIIPIPQSIRREMKTRGSTIWDWVINPVDSSIVIDSGSTEQEWLSLMAEHPDFDLLLANYNEWMHGVFETSERYNILMKDVPDKYIAVKQKYGKPMLLVVAERSIVAEDFDNPVWRYIAEQRSALQKGGIPIYPTFEQAARTARKVLDYYIRHRGDRVAKSPPRTSQTTSI